LPACRKKGMTEIFSTISAIAGGVEKLADLSKKLNNVEFLNTIADLRIEIVNLKTEVARLKDENIELKEKLKNATEKKGGGVSFANVLRS
jgi:predicted  nucleic acid-binding Zn-ribbon protein